MSQIANIFRKDCRRFWREIALSLVLLAAFTWNESHKWVPPNSTVDFFAQEWLGRLILLLLAGWWLLVVRVIQDESLVGDRQFWITRPYEWKKLLAAKVIFMLVFFNLPLLIAQMALLALAGFAPFPHLYGLLYLQLLLTGVFILPAAALATVTSSLGQFILVILGIMLAIAAALALDSFVLKTSSPWTIEGQVETWLQMTALFGAFALAVLWQYARRQPVRARWILVAGVAAIVLISAAIPDRHSIERAYPELAAAQPVPVVFALLETKKNAPADGASTRKQDQEREKETQFMIPLSASGISDSTIVAINGTRVYLSGLDGAVWDSKWRYGSDLLYQGKQPQGVSFNLNTPLYEHIKATPLKLRISFALSIYEDRNKLRIVASGGDFPVPQVGICNLRWSGIECRAALHQPLLARMVLSAADSAATCTGLPDEDPAPASWIANAWAWNNESGEFGLSPVLTESFSPSWNETRLSIANTPRPRICPGTPITFSRPELVRRIRVELDIDTVQLNQYRIHTGVFTLQGID